jgi:hypothetical protein
MATPTASAQRSDESVAEQEARLARRGAGIRVGTWDVRHPQSDTSELSSSLHFEAYYQRGLDSHVALENSVAVWRRVTQELQALPSGGDRLVETRSYIVPVFTSMKFYPVTEPPDFIEPFLVAGVGFVLGIVRVAENAIGGGGTSIATGFGVRTGLGVEIHLTKAFGIVAGGRYQWMRFSDDLGSQDAFTGPGVDGGLTYRFRF